MCAIPKAPAWLVLLFKTPARFLLFLKVGAWLLPLLKAPARFLLFLKVGTWLLPILKAAAASVVPPQRIQAAARVVLVLWDDGKDGRGRLK